MGGVNRFVPLARTALDRSFELVWRGVAHHTRGETGATFGRTTSLIRTPAARSVGRKHVSSLVDPY